MTSSTYLLAEKKPFPSLCYISSMNDTLPKKNKTLHGVDSVNTKSTKMKPLSDKVNKKGWFLRHVGFIVVVVLCLLQVVTQKIHFIPFCDAFTVHQTPSQRKQKPFEMIDTKAFVAEAARNNKNKNNSNDKRRSLRHFSTQLSFHRSNEAETESSTSAVASIASVVPTNTEESVKPKMSTLTSRSLSPNDGKYNVTILIIDHYDSFTYNLYDMFAQLTLQPPRVITKDALDDWSEEEFRGVDGIVLSPGPGSPQEQPALSKRAIHCNPHIPIFGVCLGHQLLALEYGANVTNAPLPIHGQDHWISVIDPSSNTDDTLIDGTTDDDADENACGINDDKNNRTLSKENAPDTTWPSIFEGLPSSFRAVRYHSLAATNIPSCLTVTAKSHGDNVIQGLQHSKYPHYGVQFHPESIGTQHGMALLENFCEIVRLQKDTKVEQNGMIEDRVIHQNLGNYGNLINISGPSILTTNDQEMIPDQQTINRPKRKTRIFSSEGQSPQEECQSKKEQTTKYDNSEWKEQPRYKVLMHAIPKQKSESMAVSQPLEVFESLYMSRNLNHSIWLDSSSYPSRGEIDILAAPYGDDDLIEYYYNDHHLKNSTTRPMTEDDVLTQIENRLFQKPYRITNDDMKNDGPTTMMQQCPPSNDIAMITEQDINKEEENNSLSPKSSDEMDTLQGMNVVWKKDDENLNEPPFEYRGGFLGYLGYEVRHDTTRRQHHHHQQVSSTDNDDNDDSDRRQDMPSNIKDINQTRLPTAAFFLARQSMVFHHPTQQWYLVCLVETDNENETALHSIEWMRDVLKQMKKLEKGHGSKMKGINLSTEPVDNDANDKYKTITSSESVTDDSSSTLRQEEEGHSVESNLLQFTPNRPKEKYEKDIAACHEYIRMGESYELCLTNQLEATVQIPSSQGKNDRTSDTDKNSNSNNSKMFWELYKILRRRNPAPHSAFFSWKMLRPTIGSPMEEQKRQQRDDNYMSICCSSPERFMSIRRKKQSDQHGRSTVVRLQAEAKPIKGTCARVIPKFRSNINSIHISESIVNHTDNEGWTDLELREDERRARSLQVSLKNRAENLMIVDLLRNDMSRVCQVGSVHVSNLMGIESFATVHQMVSTIRGTLPPPRNSNDSSSSSSSTDAIEGTTTTTTTTTTAIDLLRASFPGGSMTGAPKIRTMELLDDLEDGIDRGPYSGSLGYISVNGCMDMNIIIRSAVAEPILTTNERNVNDLACHHDTSTASDSDSGTATDTTTGTASFKISIGAGGAITALSETEDEYDEMLLKARAVVQAVQEWAQRYSLKYLR